MSILHFSRCDCRGRLLPVLATLALSMPLLTGCGGGGGGSSTKVLQGDAAFRAGTVAEYKSLGAGGSYPFAALKLAAPSGSPLHGATATSLVRTLSTRKSRAASRAGGLTLAPFLNLYTDGGVLSGHVYTISYFSDSAGTQAAGTMKITLPSNLTDPNDPLSFASYPVTIPIDVNLTGGTLPCQGSVQIKFGGASGTNAMTGTLTLTKDNVTFALNLGLSETFEVSGAITIKENGSTIQITNVHGNLSGDLQCDVAVTPNGGSGTGTLNLNTGVMTVNLTTGTAASDGSGSLTLNYKDGTQETVANALAASLTSSGSTGTGTGTGGTSAVAYNAPTIFTSDQRIFLMLNKSGQAIGKVGPNSNSYFFSSPTATPQALAATAGDSGALATSLNDNGQIVGNAIVNAGTSYHPLYWSAATAAPQELAVPTGMGYVTVSSINNRGEIVGSTGGSVNNGVGVALYWSSPTATPQILAPLPGIQYARADFISADGQIIGSALDVGGGKIVWTSPTATPQLLAALPDDSSALPMAFGPNGLIVGASATSNGIQHAVTWASPSAPAQQLPEIPNIVGPHGSANSINSSGVMVGYVSGQTLTSDLISGAALWKDGKLQLLNSLIPSGNIWSLDNALQITDQGWILGTATHYNASTLHYDTAQFLITPK